MSEGNGDNQFNYPSSICFKYQFLYVCDSYNKRIHKFNKNLEFIKLLKLEYQPMELTVFCSELVVKSLDSKIYFYDINSLNFKRKSNEAFIFNISEIDTIFYKAHLNKVDCYDQNGNFIDNIQLNDDCNFGKLVLFNNTVLMSSLFRKKLIKFQ